METFKHENNGQQAINVNLLVDQLCSSDRLLREKARKRLVNKGIYAVPALLGALKHRNPHARREAAKALKVIGEPSCLPGLIRALSDEHADVRWLAAEALVEYGSAVLPLMYRALINHRNHDIVWLHLGAHHVLHAYAERHDDEHVKAVLEALDGPVSSYVAIAAFEALKVILE